MGPRGVHSTALYYPLVATPMIAPTKAYEGLPALTSEEAAEWMVTAARTRPVRIAPRMAIAARRAGHRRTPLGELRSCSARTQPNRETGQLTGPSC